MTWERIGRVVDPSLIRIATSERYAPRVIEDLDIDPSLVVTEPARRNTAPAIAYAAEMLRAELGDDHITGVFPSDHFVAGEDAFSDALSIAFDLAESSASLVTLAVEPTAPSIEYGYLELGSKIEDQAREVVRFVEKPDAETAARLVESGSYRWNAGIFVWRYDSFRRELEAAAPEIAGIAAALASGAPIERYLEMPDISIDYALMERASQVVAVSVDAGWSDLGSWDALAELIQSDEDAHLVESIDTIVKRSSSKPIVVAGVDRVIVIETDDGILVLDRNRAHLMKDVVRMLKSGN